MPDADTRIMERIRDGDRDAVVELVQSYQNEIVGFFYNQCWDQGVAEELAQELFVNVYRSRNRYQATARLRTFLYSIARNIWIDHLRRQKHRATISLDAEIGSSALRLVDMVASRPTEGDAMARDQHIRMRVQQALEALPDGQREVFILANNQDMKYSQISEVLGIPEGTVKSRMHNAVRFLREELQDLIEP